VRPVVDPKDKEVDMALPAAAETASHYVDTSCPLCGTSLLSVDFDGRVEVELLHPVPLHKNRDASEGYVICEQCALLANLPSTITLN
jgi:hypothetical protein